MNEKTPDAAKKKKNSNWTTWLLIGMMLLGAAIIAYPSVSDWWNSFHSTRAIVSYSKQVEEMDTALLSSMIDAAHDYNDRLMQKENPYAMSDEDLEEYNSLLDLSGTGLMGYIQIKAINVYIPIYHGTEENVLQIAVGHLDWTALPVGGVGTHAVLSGHRGLPSAKLFTDLDKIKEGDRFSITVLNQTIMYEVDQIRIVEPGDIKELGAVPGMDYCTLVTCTPYGINTHRMLVRGHRVEGEGGQLVVPAEAIILPNYITIPAVGIPLLFIFLLGLMVATRRKKPKVRAADILALQREMESKQNGGSEP